MIQNAHVLTPHSADAIHLALEWLACLSLSSTLNIMVLTRPRQPAQPGPRPDPHRDRGKTENALLQEVNHRVKNNFTSLIGLVQLKRDVAGSEQEAACLLDMESKLSGLARVHALLSGNDWRPIRLEDLCRSVVRTGTTLAAQPCQYHITSNTPGLRINHQQAHPLTLVLSELISNAFKHGRSDTPLLMITLTLDQSGNRILLDFNDNGPGYPPSVLKHAQGHPARGLQIVHALVSSSLRGQFTLANTTGASARISFPKDA